MMKINYVTLYAYSFTSEIDFCTQKLGFEVLKQTRFLNQNDCVILKKGGLLFSLMLFEDQQSTQKSTLILSTDDFLRDHFEMKGKGVEFLSEPEYTAVGLAAAFKDPSDNQWILMEERDYSAN